MKKLATLLLAAGLVFGAATGASAIDFKAKGNWTMNFDYGSGSKFMSEGRDGRDVYGYGGRGANSNAEDNFSAAQRVRLQLDAIASEALSGTVYFEIGTQPWGKGDKGAALGTDGIQVKVRRAYLDWIVPNTELKVRMGLQGLALPSFAMGSGGSQVFDDDVAGITLSNKFNDNVALTAFWMRPYNDNFNGNSAKAAGFMDNVDLFGLAVPLTFDGFKITPWGVVGAVGPYAFSTTPWNTANYGNAVGRAIEGMRPAVVSKSKNVSEYDVPFWLGLGGEITAADPFRFAWDVNYGNNGAQHEYYKRDGWFASILAEYKMDWGTPGLYAWYSSGDDGDVKNGSERMPTFSANGTNGYSNYGLTGAPQITRDGVIGYTVLGTWGIGARLKDMSFIEGLKSTFAVNFYNGTNNPTMAKYIRGVNPEAVPGYVNPANNYYGNDFNAGKDLYLTWQDYALEFSLANSYKIYDNLTLYTQASYIALWLDQSRKVWGNNYAYTNSRGLEATDAWNINVSFMYDF